MWQLSEFQCPRDTSASKSGRCFLACSNHAWQARHLHQNQFLQWRATRTIPTSLSNLSTRDLRNLREMKIFLGPLNPETACRNSSLGLRCSLGSEVMNMTQKHTPKNIKTPLGAKWLCRKFRENYMENSKNDGWWWVMIIFHKEFQALQPHKKVTFMAGGYPRGWIPDCRDETPSILPFLKWHAASRSFLILACFDMNFRSFSGSIQSHSIYSFSWDCILTISGFKTSRFQMLPDLQENFRARHGTWHRPRGVESTALEWTAASAAGPKRAKLSPRPHLGG